MKKLEKDIIMLNFIAPGQVTGNRFPLYFLLVFIQMFIIFMPVCQGGDNVNLLDNPGFEKNKAGWSPYKKGFEISRTTAHTGNYSIYVKRDNVSRHHKDAHGARQAVEFKKPLFGNIRFSVFCKATNINEGSPKVSLGIFYSDGTVHWGNTLTLNVSDHWEERSVIIPQRQYPVTKISVTFFFKGIGEVWLDDAQLSFSKKTPFVINNLKVLNGLFGGDGAAVSGDANRAAAWEVRFISEGKILGAQSGENNIYALLPEWSGDKLKISLKAQEKYNSSSAVSREFYISKPDFKQQRPYAVWCCSSMDRVMPKSLPDKIHENPVWQMELAKNETEGFQIAVLPQPGSRIGNAAIEISDLKEEKTGRILSSACISWRQLGFVELKKVNPHPANRYQLAGWRSDPLLPVEKAKIIKDNLTGLWINVAAPVDCAGGTYSGTIKIQPQKAKPVIVNLKVKVWNFALPERSSFKAIFDFKQTYLKRIYGPEKYPEMCRRYIEYITGHRIDFALAPRELIPLELVIPYKNRLNMVNAGIYIDKKCKDEAKAVSRLKKLLPSYVKAIRKNGLAKYAFFYGFDEFTDPDIPFVKKVLGMLKRTYPDIPTFTTTTVVPVTVEAMNELHIDWVCKMFNRYDYRKAEMVRKRDHAKQVWGYISFQPGYPYVNFMVTYPLIESRVVFWQCFQQKMDGFLYWGLNKYGSSGCRAETRIPINPENGPQVSWSVTTGAPGSRHDTLHGDGKILYYGVDGPIGSIRLENIRDGLEDYEYLALLSKLEASKKEALKLGSGVTKSFTDFTRDNKVIYQQRRLLAEKIEKLMKN
ncbi:MAG: glycoside hydrolase domain-containing protein [Victivallaceae bacterium]